jgi:hypothetical protein
MRRANFILVCIASLGLTSARYANGQSYAPADSSSLSKGADPRMIDGVAARIEDDVITESEVRELAAFQLLADGREKPRGELIRELTDQWIVNSEARVAHYEPPPEEEVNRALATFVGKFSSPEEFQKRRSQVNLTDADVRRLLTKQIYLTRFLDYRFRPAAQVDAKRIEAYYNNELAPKLRAQAQAVPALEDVADTIQEVLVQRAISERSSEWLNETRARLKIDVMSDGDGT